MDKEVRISNELLSDLCRESIDVSLVGDVIEQAESKGLKVFDESTGLYHAHMKIGNITLWVSYGSEEGYIDVKEAYMHRIEIKE